MQDYAQLEALLAVEREGSIDAAARAMGMTSSAVSQRLKSLEERIGAVVLKRLSPVEPNEFGSALCRHAEAVSLMEDALMQRFAVGAAANDGTPPILKVVVNDDSLSSWFMDVLHQEAKRGTQFRFEIALEDQDRSINAMRQGLANVAISNEQEAVQGFNCKYLGGHIYKATATPAFVSKYFPQGVSETKLKEAPHLRHSSNDRLHSQWMSKYLGADIEVDSHTIPSSHSFVSACLRDVGWGVNSSIMVDDHIRDGELVELIPDAPLNKPLYWHCSRHICDSLKDVTRNVMSAANDHLCQDERPNTT